ncbi:cytochrome c biogenesis protein/redoxin [Catenulispora rubra]|uniref:cytochrome c biogenesis protein/redoxin n=1 Tax=Catenulispora rubra TaxID=280293 RepID=UPI002B2794E7|nr:cytochrome c biogenesis protein/redoxin [Catenulispora rubra]
MITLVLIGLVGGLITGISPCVLPMLPVLFFTGGAAGAGDRPGAPEPAGLSDLSDLSDPSRRRTSRRPYLIVAGLVLSFSVFTLLGTLVVSALPVPKDIIRWAGLVVLVLLGIAMMFPRVEDLLERPFNRIPQRRVADEHGGFVLGLALGTVYVPCAGPVLAAITVAGASGRIGVGTVALTVAFAVGTALPLLAFALAGRRVAERVRAFRSRQRGVRITAGVVVIALAVALTFNVTDALQRAVPDYTSNLNAALDKSGASHALAPASPKALANCVQAQMTTLGDCGRAPAISGIQQWYNTPAGAALTPASLSGKVVLVDFWAYSCINCQRAIKHVQAWYSDYAADGLVVIGVQTPEYTFEADPGDVAAGAKRLGITYPVALDSKYTTWNSFGNDSWPADYLIDSTGEVRFASAGEGAYSNTESLIRQLLTAAHPGSPALALLRGSAGRHPVRDAPARQAAGGDHPVLGLQPGHRRRQRPRPPRRLLGLGPRHPLPPPDLRRPGLEHPRQGRHHGLPDQLGRHGPALGHSLRQRRDPEPHGGQGHHQDPEPPSQRIRRGRGVHGEGQVRHPAPGHGDHPVPDLGGERPRRGDGAGVGRFLS